MSLAKPRIKARCSGAKRGKRPMQTALCLSASTASGGVSQFEASPLYSSCSDQNPSPDLSLASSAFSSESQVARARVAVKQRRQELKSIRQESENVQAYLKGRLHELSKTCEWEGLDYYTRELEKLKDCVSDRESAMQLQGELRRREVESEELRRTVSRLEQTVLDLGGSVNLGGMEVETGKKQDNSLCASSCQLF